MTSTPPKFNLHRGPRPSLKQKILYWIAPPGAPLWRISLFPAGLALLLLFLIFALPLGQGGLDRRAANQALPDFKAISDAQERKVAFFTFLQPLVELANAEVSVRRQRLEGWLAEAKRGKRFSSSTLRRIATEAEYARLEMPEQPDETFLTSLLERVDTVPVSLAMAQAAIESGWGTSRFAREGNNLYGIWCYTPGCGIVPARRPAGANHEVKSYDYPFGSTADYLQHLNTGAAYAHLREIRAQLRAEGKPMTGLALAPGLDRYSALGWEYVEMVRGMIRANKLQERDQPPAPPQS